MSQSLHSVLEDLYAKFHHPRFMQLDPIELVHEFSGARNREIAGLVASALAYGKVEIIRANLKRIFSITGKDLVDFSRSAAFSKKKKLFEDFKHRFTTGSDIAVLFQCIGKALAEKGSLELLFYEGLSLKTHNIKQPLNEFSKTMHHWRSLIENPGSLNVKAKKDHAFRCRIAAKTSEEKISHESFEYLFPLPQRGSACKRLNMFLRWMVRRSDGIDFGVWTRIDPADLVIPVDTHVAAIARKLGLTQRKTADWAMAEEITENLKKINPSDPVKYDFSICRSGMVEFRRK